MILIDFSISTFPKKLPKEKFPDSKLTHWRMGLLLYSHIVEMDATYEVITNLLRYRLGKGYSPNPYFKFLTEKEQKNYRKRGIYPSRKIEIIKELSEEAELKEVGVLFDEFYNSKLRNSISHSDYILTEEEYRVRNGTGSVGAYKIKLEDLDALITKAKAFIASFFQLEMNTRGYLGHNYSGKAIPYDKKYKGLLEILVDKNKLMSGFKVHWPNNSESYYKRTDDGIDMVNCTLDLGNSSIGLFVGRYAINKSEFSPLVEKDGNPEYTRLENGTKIEGWKEN